MKRKGFAAAVIAAASMLIFAACSSSVENMSYSFYGEDGTYSGGWKDDRPEGNGTFSNDGGWFIDGRWKDGRLDGEVTIKGAYSADGSFEYVGSVAPSDTEFIPDGMGRLHSEDADTVMDIDGLWINGRTSGTVKLTVKTGDELMEYECELEDMIPNGKGKLHYSGPDEIYDFEGTFYQGGLYNGTLTMYNADGSVKETMEIADGTFK